VRAKKAGNPGEKLLQLVVLLQRIERPGQTPDVDIRGEPEGHIFGVPGETAEKPLALSVLHDGDLIPAVQADELVAVQFRSDDFERSEDDPRDSGSAEPSDPGEGGVIRAVVAKDGQQGDAQVQAEAETHAREHDREDRVVNGGQKHGEAGEEEEHGDVQQRRQRRDGPGQMQLLYPLGEKRADARALVRAVPRLRHAEVPAGPLLQRRGEQGACEADHEAREPESVVPDGGPRRPERGRIGGRRGQRDRYRRRLRPVATGGG